MRERRLPHVRPFGLSEGQAHAKHGTDGMAFRRDPAAVRLDDGMGNAQEHSAQKPYFREDHFSGEQACERPDKQAKKSMGKHADDIELREPFGTNLRNAQ